MHIPADFLLSTVLYQISFRLSLTVQFPISYHALHTLFPVFCNTFLSVFHYFKVYSATFHANSISQPHNLISSLRRKWNKKAEAICSAPLEMPLFRHRLLSLYILSHFRLRSKV